MPMNKARYPKDWARISAEVRARAGNRCERCGVANGAIGARDWFGQWRDEDDIDSLNSAVGLYLYGDYPKMTRIVLTVHHLGITKPDGSPGDPEDKMDCRPENLICLCQKCHLEADRPASLVKARHTRLVAVEKKGQLRLID